jgi:Putative beta-barrel porin-2, OmpL-like. bbp2
VPYAVSFGRVRIHLTGRDALGRTVAQVTEKGVEEVSTVKWTIAIGVLAFCACPAMAQESIQTAFNYNLADDAMAPDASAPAAAAPACGCEEPACGCEEASCGCDSGCCDSCGGGCSLCGDCCLGDPCTLKDYLTPCCCDYNYGGWVSIGYHTDFTRFSDENTQLLSFNDHPDHLNFDQVWFYGEKVANAGACSSDWGFRYDMLYGLDAQKTQAFGNEHPVWDVTFDNGVYGWAIPQAYAEVAYGDWSIKAGHFFTVVGYEVVPDPDNFFYSHSFTFFNSEPFTHTGVLATYTANDCLTVYNGWTLGWDTGFDQFGNGSNYLGGLSYTKNDVTFTYILTAGDLGWRGEGYTHSIVADAKLSDKWEYVLQSDYVKVTPTNAGGFDDTDIGINQYLFYTLNDCWAVGGRMEWWKSDFQSAGPDNRSYYELTGGINYKPHANVIVRPEIRYNWTPAEDAYENDWGVDFNQTVFGIDAIFTY